MRWREARVLVVATVVPLLLGLPAAATDTPRDGGSQRSGGSADSTGGGVAETMRTPDAGTAVPDSAAADHVGQEVTIEGRVHQTHVSPLATVLAFGPNFSGFTATIQAADRINFPPDVAERARDQRVRVHGLVTAYRGHPEMTLRDPSQLVLLTPAGEIAPERPAATPTPDIGAQATRDALARIEARLNAIESRIAALEAVPAGSAEALPATLAIGMPAAEVRGLFGDPIAVRPASTGGQIWVYDAGRIVRLDARGQVAGWAGF